MKNNQQNLLTKTVWTQKDLYSYISSLTGASTDLIQAVLTMYQNSILDFLFLSNHYLEKDRQIAFAGWGTLRFEEAYFRVPTYARPRPGFVFMPSLRIARGHYHPLDLPEEKRSANIQALTKDLYSRFYDRQNKLLNTPSWTEYRYVKSHRTTTKQADIEKQRWTESDIVFYISASTQFPRVLIRGILHAYRQAIIDFFISCPPQERISKLNKGKIPSNRKQIVLSKWGTIYWSNKLKYKNVDRYYSGPVLTPSKALTRTLVLLMQDELENTI